MRLLVPAYFAPQARHHWAELIHSGGTVGTVILNPDNGCGRRLDPSYGALVAEMKAQGLEALGYVHTDYGERSLWTVRGEMSRYRRWYSVDGVFLDEVPGPDSTPRQAGYYRKAAGSARRGGARLVVGNPGGEAEPSYLEFLDVLVIFEGPLERYNSWWPPKWTRRFPPERFAHLVFATPRSRLAEAMARAAGYGAGWVYVTDGDLPNPWRGLPSYWRSLVATVSRAWEGRGTL